MSEIAIYEKEPHPIEIAITRPIQRQRPDDFVDYSLDVGYYGNRNKVRLDRPTGAAGGPPLCPGPRLSHGR